MATIQVFFAAELQAEYPLNDKLEVTVGRGSGCDIVIDNAAVSRHHCTLREVRRKWTVVDEGSSNGTFVNGEKIAQHELQHKDRIVLGKHTLLFNQYGISPEAAQSQGRAEETSNGTVLVSPGALAQMLERSKQQPMALVLHGVKRQVIPLSQDKTLIGAAAHCHLRISGWLVKGEQAYVVKTGTGHKIIHTGGWRSLHVNGEKYRETVLSVGDVIAIAGNKIAYGSL
jgi:pSer/pThr/pTyr-binding forkhead associated (FHA) protein